MANKQNLSLLKKNLNLCEINTEYPSLMKQSTMSRHLCTTEKIVKHVEANNTDKLSNKVTTEHQEKESNKHSKDVPEQTEIIELFQYKEEEERNHKLSRKRRYRRTDQSVDDNDNNQRDNTN